MSAFALPAGFADLHFRWPWRDYQARVLEAMDGHLRDRRLHVVAAPGSGKTVLGLEVFRRLAKPTLVLSPTRTIRDQWLLRLGDFLPAGERSDRLDWQSRDLRDLRWFNSLTYQALHTRVRRESVEAGSIEEIEGEELRQETEGDVPDAQVLGEVAASLAAAGIGVLILDEAHHLRAEWWTAIQRIVERLEGIIVVSLTATPPYDVLGHEWNRYTDLCGPIDEEISVPELVKAGTLCPHQDFVWLVRCEGGEAERLRKHRAAVSALLAELAADPLLLEDVSAHAWVRDPVAHVNDLINAPEMATALAGYLHLRGHICEPLMHLLDLTAEDLPPFTVRQWQHLLRLYLFGVGWPDDTHCEQRREALGRRLRRDELLWRKELALTEAGQRWPDLALNSAKTQACVEIHQSECRYRGEHLRQVILTDYIRDDDYKRPIQGDLPLGAWPLFHRLVGGASPCRLSALALHTGRLSIVHADLVPVLTEWFEPGSLQVREVPALQDYREVSLAGSARLTSALTRLLIEGRIQVLIGTRALLGEGWDAPPVNSLILASVVGSFMTTNQMRGRAIRIDPRQPDKVASIWHLGAYAQLDQEGWDVRDLDDMGRRFETFVGLDHRQPVIEAGLNRLHAGFWRKDCVQNSALRGRAVNMAMTRRLRRLDEVKKRWHEAIDRSEIGRVVPSVQVERPPKFSIFWFAQTWRVLAFQLFGLALTLFGALGLQMLQNTQLRQTPGVLFKVVLTIGAAVVLAMLPRAFRLGVLWWRFLPVDGAVRAIARAVREALCESGLLPAALRDSPLVVGENNGVWYVALSEGSFIERSLFADCLNEVLAPIERPRYLITRVVRRKRGNGIDYHAVPAVLGIRAERAEAFLRAWHKHVAKAELIHTRGEDGREVLLKARSRSFANAYERAARRMDRWF